MEHFGLVQTAAPASEPLSRDEAKAFCRIDAEDTSQDSLVDTLIAAARQRCEKTTRRALVTQTWRVTFDRFPGLVFVTPDYPGWEYLRLGADGDPRVIRLPRPPLQSVTSVQYVDTAGVLQTISSSDYLVDTDTELGRLFPAYGTYWPVTRPQANAVRIVYVAGYGAASDVPADLKHRLLVHVAHSFERREDADEAFLEKLFESFAIGSYF